MGIQRSGNFPNYLSVGAAAGTGGLLFIALQAAMDFYKYLHCSRTSIDLSNSRGEASKELGPGKKKAIF